MTNAAAFRNTRSDADLLAAYARRPSPELLERLVERFLPLARSLASRYKGGAEPFEDLEQVANMGLVKAIKGFDPERRNSFTSYAVPTILGELRRHFRDRVWNLRLPRALQESTMSVERAMERLPETIGRQPTVRELAEEAGLDEDVVLESLVAREARWTSSVDAPVRSDEEAGVTRLDQLGSRDAGFDRVEADAAAATADLDQRERTILELLYDKGLTQAETGARLGCSQMQVSRLSRRALTKLLGAVQGSDRAPIAAEAPIAA